MGQTLRFGVSLDEDLLRPFDALCAERGYGNRSEAIRDLIRKALVEASEREAGECAGTLSLIFDHHIPELTKKLTTLQHKDHDIVIAGMHVHLDHHNCLEVLVLRGAAQRVRKLVDILCAVRGVKHGSFSLTGTGRGLV